MASRRGQSKLDLNSLAGENMDLKYKRNTIGEHHAYYKENPTRDTNSYLPWCKTGGSKLANKYVSLESCNLFQPVVTELGICYAFNALPTLDFLHDSKFTRAFIGSYGSDLLKMNMSYGTGTGSEHDLTFYYHANNIGRKSLNPIQAFYVSFTSASEYFMQGDRLEAKIGIDTQIRIQPMEIVPTEHLRHVDVKKRKCFFSDEAKGKVNRFKKYSQSACILECTIAAAEKYCQCLPWYYPNDPSNDTFKICDLYGNFCFDNFFTKVNDAELNCQCWPDCHDTQYTIIEKNYPLDPEQLCNDQYSVPFQLAEKTLETDLASLFYKFHKVYRNDFNISFDTDGKKMEICKELVLNDLAKVSVSFASKKFVRTIKDERVTFSDQLATLGKRYLTQMGYH